MKHVVTEKKSWTGSMGSAASIMLGLFLLFASSSALAEHFHYFVDVETNFAVNQHNQITH